MREAPVSVRAWIRQDLSARFAAVLKEEIPQSMLEALHTSARQD